MIRTLAPIRPGGRELGERRVLPFAAVRGIWLWMQVVIVICVLASAVIAIVKLYL